MVTIKFLYIFFVNMHMLKIIKLCMISICDLMYVNQTAFLIHLFLACWVFVEAGELSLVAASGGGYSLAAVYEFLIAAASLVAEWVLGREGFSSCST